MFKVALKWSVTAVALCTALPSAKADYTYRCDPLPAAILVESRGPLPEGLSPLARRHVDDLRWHSERTEVVRLDTPNIIIVNFQIATDDQAETDRYWDAIVGNGGQESECGWCKDKWGLSWQFTPRVLTEALARGGDVAKRAFEAMMTMKKIDVAAIKAARHG